VEDALFVGAREIGSSVFLVSSIPDDELASHAGDLGLMQGRASRRTGAREERRASMKGEERWQT
jgi:hypothetical protein